MWIKRWVYSMVDYSKTKKIELTSVLSIWYWQFGHSLFTPQSLIWFSAGRPAFFTFLASPLPSISQALFHTDTHQEKRLKNNFSNKEAKHFQHRSEARIFKIYTRGNQTKQDTELDTKWEQEKVPSYAIHEGTCIIILLNYTKYSVELHLKPKPLCPAIEFLLWMNHLILEALQINQYPKSMRNQKKFWLNVQRVF